MRNVAGILVERLRVPNRNEPYSWTSAEAAIGLPLPADYKELIDRIGPVIINDFLALFGPAADSGSDIAGLVEERDDAWDVFRGSVDLPERYFQDGQRLLAFAAAEENYFYWHAHKDVLPDEWGVVIATGDLDAWYEFDLSATECLLGILTGDIRLRPFEGWFDPAGVQAEPFSG